MTTEENMIPIEPYLKDFKQYLDANSRSILSAKFGNGKSYFVSRFMKEYSKDYLFIPIYPVNYQVMDNKDIFELIKRDILIKLLSSEEININEIELNAASLFYYFFTNNQEDRLLDILSIIPDINIYGIDINISNVIKKLKEVKDKFATYKKQFKSDDETYESYITQFDSLKGSIYEFDTISQLICDIIREYKKQHPSKEVVLIIEDLDRIDPGHIFRILNVFSAHFDRYTTGLMEFEKTCGDNKFCLDKIVTVCDIENIKNIYSHIYGEKTDFIGYISKFSNSKEYDYSLMEKMKEYIVNALLDKSLLKYPQICDALSQAIVSLMDRENTVESNIRIIKERIGKVNFMIKYRKVKLPKGLENKYITSDSDFIKLLSILKIFNLNINIVNTKNMERELLDIIGNWGVLASFFDKRIYFSCHNNILFATTINEIGHGIRREENYSEIRNCFKGNRLMNIDLSTWDNTPLISLIIKQINNIVHFLSKETII